MVFTLNCQQTCNNGEDDEAEDVCGIAPSPFHLPSLAERRNLTLRSSMLQCNIDAMNNPTKTKDQWQFAHYKTFVVQMSIKCFTEEEGQAAPQRLDPRWQHCPGRSAQSCTVALLPEDLKFRILDQEIFFAVAKKFSASCKLLSGSWVDHFDVKLENYNLRSRKRSF